MHYMKSHGMHRGSKVFCLASLRPPQARPKFRLTSRSFIYYVSFCMPSVINSCQDTMDPLGCDYWIDN